MSDIEEANNLCQKFAETTNTIVIELIEAAKNEKNPKHQFALYKT